MQTSSRNAKKLYWGSIRGPKRGPKRDSKRGPKRVPKRYSKGVIFERKRKQALSLMLDFTLSQLTRLV